MINPEKVTRHIVAWLSDYLENTEMSGFILGVSGGVDSAVTAFLCAKTGHPSYTLGMPIFQSEDQKVRAQSLGRRLSKKYPNSHFSEIEMTSSFEAFIACSQAEATPLVLANTRARLRMVMLYYYAGVHKALVTGTGNKVEDFGIGFFTKYGDGGVDLSPIADLYKSEVYELAHYLGVPREIIEAPPTDGLYSEEQTDEAQIGASYEELEEVMYRQESLAGDREVLSEREMEVERIFEERHRQNQHKMQLPPVCIIPDSFKW